MSSMRSTKRNYTGMKRTASGGGISRSSAQPDRMRFPRFAMCINNDGNPASLELGKVYKIIRPARGDPSYMVRVIDNDGEDYLYYARQFVPVDLPPKARRVVTMA